MVKRSLLYLCRKYKRSILLFLLLFVISFSLAVGVTVWGSIGAVTKEVQDRLGTSFLVKMPALDPENTEYTEPAFRKDGSVTKVYVGDMLDQKLVDTIMQVDGVTAYNGEMSCYLCADNLELVEGLVDAIYKLTSDNPEHLVNYLDMGGWDYLETGRRTTKLYGNTDTSLYQKFRTGAFELVEGRHITEKDQRKVLISEELAACNDLHIGDTIDISMREYHLGRYDDVKRILGETQLEIVGIFHVNGFQPTGDVISEDEITYNWLLTDIDTAYWADTVWNKGYYQDFSYGFAYDNLSFFVDKPAELEQIISQVKSLDQGAVSFFDISLDDTMYKSTVDPLNSIRNLVAGLVGAITVGCMIVLLIVFTMWVRSRRQEVAIYLSLGISKVKILGQFVLEAVIVAALALAVALPVSAPITDAIGNQMLASTIAASQPQEKEYSQEEIYNAAMNGKMSELFSYESSSYAGPESIDFSFGFAQLMLLAGLEVLIILAAICKGGSFIYKLQPRQILTTLR
ncbi:ABC transporter permease [Agathobaculum sp. Marseille-P7918]|uniref:ABC transporter permease n=1 Tax=Agathobaculum sp. Marseille-P7918 TaxID=2479843 RepID=UPI0013DE3577|nr:FtsX-like permease family protein [Agathobaculum sp. Marseille-P7918]